MTGSRTCSPALSVSLWNASPEAAAVVTQSNLTLLVGAERSFSSQSSHSVWELLRTLLLYLPGPKPAETSETRTGTRQHHVRERTGSEVRHFKCFSGRLSKAGETVLVSFGESCRKRLVPLFVLQSPHTVSGRVLCLVLSVVSGSGLSGYFEVSRCRLESQTTCWVWKWILQVDVRPVLTSSHCNWNRWLNSAAEPQYNLVLLRFHRFCFYPVLSFFKQTWINMLSNQWGNEKSELKRPQGLSKSNFHKTAGLYGGAGSPGATLLSWTLSVQTLFWPSGFWRVLVLIQFLLKADTALMLSEGQSRGQSVLVCGGLHGAGLCRSVVVWVVLVCGVVVCVGLVCGGLWWSAVSCCWLTAVSSTPPMFSDWLEVQGSG